jgi:hypothetical protein
MCLSFITSYQPWDPFSHLSIETVEALSSEVKLTVHEMPYPHPCIAEAKH